MIIISHFPIFGIFQHINTVILISIHQFTTYYTDYTSQYFYISPYIRVYTIHIYSNISYISPDNIIIGSVYGKIETGTPRWFPVKIFTETNPMVQILVRPRRGCIWKSPKIGAAAWTSISLKPW